MLVGLSQIGGSLPNVALMRLSSYHRALGDQVLLNPTPLDHPDLVYISTLFTWRKREVEGLAAHFRPFADVQIGGTGWDLEVRLPPEVDAMPNDYSLYGVDFGMGYSSRGCPRSCEFCPVSRVEGRRVREATAIADLLNPSGSPRLVLLDNNFFLSEWRPKIAEIRERRLEISWPQGLDIRVVDEEQAAVLGDLRTRRQLWNQRFTRRNRLHFAWDQPTTPASEVRRGVGLLLAAGFTPDDIEFYALIGFDGYEVAEELERLRVLHELGIQPKVMVYRDFSERDARDPIRMDIQHWNDGHLWRAVPFKNYRRARCGRAAA